MQANSILSKLVKPQEEYLNERQLLARDMTRELACLVETKGYLYAQRVANEIQQEFQCRPTDPGWLVYTTIQYALNQLFERIRVRVKSLDDTPRSGSILAEIKENYDSTSRRNSTGSRRSATSARKRRRTG